MAERGEGQQDDPLKQALAEYLAIPGMQAALLVSDQGLVISRAAHPDVDTASIHHERVSELLTYRTTAK